MTGETGGQVHGRGTTAAFIPPRAKVKASIKLKGDVYAVVRAAPDGLSVAVLGRKFDAKLLRQALDELTAGSRPLLVEEDGVVRLAGPGEPIKLNGVHHAEAGLRHEPASSLPTGSTTRPAVAAEAGHLPPELAALFGARVKAKRLELGLSQKALSRQLGLSNAMITFVENGHTKQYGARVAAILRAWLDSTSPPSSIADAATTTTGTSAHESPAVAPAVDEGEPVTPPPVNVEGPGGTPSTEAGGGKWAHVDRLVRRWREHERAIDEIKGELAAVLL